jgi:hypothetical protein
MAYREPAENEEAKLDLEEIAAFERVIARQKRAQYIRVAGYVLACACAFATIGFVLLLRGERTAGWQHRPDCHVVMHMTVDNYGHATTTDELE